MLSCSKIIRLSCCSVPTRVVVAAVNSSSHAAELHEAATAGNSNGATGHARTSIGDSWHVGRPIVRAFVIAMAQRHHASPNPLRMTALCSQVSPWTTSSVVITAAIVNVRLHGWRLPVAGLRSTKKCNVLVSRSDGMLPSHRCICDAISSTRPLSKPFMSCTICPRPYTKIIEKSNLRSALLSLLSICRGNVLQLNAMQNAC